MGDGIFLLAFNLAISNLILDAPNQPLVICGGIRRGFYRTPYDIPGGSDDFRMEYDCVLPTGHRTKLGGVQYAAVGPISLAGVKPQLRNFVL